MKDKRHSYIIYFITAVIGMTLAIQVYWNYKNYEAGKLQLQRDVQISLDQAVNDYYESLAAKTTQELKRLGGETGLFLGQRVDTIDNDGWITKSGITQITITDDGNKKIAIDELDSLTAHFPNKNYTRLLSEDDSGNNKNVSYKFFGTDKAVVDSLYNKVRNKREDSINADFFAANSLRDSFPSNSQERRFFALNKLTSKIVVSFTSDSLDVKKLDSIVAERLQSININRKAHSLTYSPKGDTVQRTIPGLPAHLNPKHDLYVFASSELLPIESILSVGFDDIPSIILKRNLLGILLSLLLVSTIIATLLYLLRIIQHQKQLAEIKNDFISNITHEFKTPIATIGVAMESIQFFNEANDIEKTEKYVDMSSQQVAKLNTMVEKLLETATLDSEALMLNKQEANMAELLAHISQSHQETLNGKTLSLDIENEDIEISVDLFHLENALDNIIDNAIKYGGDHINIKLRKATSGVHIDITDGGNDLTKTQSQQIFEKFYRVPKGNTHDVKGFGIGLYYTKTIIEKHGGTIAVHTQPTTFKITLPNV